MLMTHSANLVTEPVTETADPSQTGAHLVALTNLCKASADTLRLLVLRVLRTDSFGVSELCSIFDIRQPALSHHLKVLANAGLVAARREANSIFYRRSELGQDTHLEALQNSLFNTVDRIDLPPDIEGRLAGLQRQREENSANFFRDNAHKFHEQQDLIASYHQYADVVLQVLKDTPLKRHSTAVEVGPGRRIVPAGTGAPVRPSGRAGQRARYVGEARGKTSAAGLNNIEFILDDTRSSNLHTMQADCVVMNMVLHHTPEPGEVLQGRGCLPGTGRRGAGNRFVQPRPGLGAGELRRSLAGPRPAGSGAVGHRSRSRRAGQVSTWRSAMASKYRCGCLAEPD